MWQPDNVSGDGSFQGFTQKLLDSKDPVVKQIRRALVQCLHDFYMHRSGEEGAATSTALNQLVAPKDAPTVAVLPVSPEVVFAGLIYLDLEGTLETMKKQLSDVLDSYVMKRQFRKSLGVSELD